MSPFSEPLPTIQVGLGPWGLDWATTILPSAPSVRVVARVDAEPARAAAIDDGVPIFASLREALDSTDAAAVLVTARIEAHECLAREALLAGKHVLLEKPFVVTLDEARGLNELAASKGLVLCIAQNYRFWPVVQAARALLREDAIGELLNARILFRRDHGTYGPSVAAPEGAPTGSILYQIAVHHFDLVRALLGEVVAVTARRWERGTLPGRLTALSALLELESGLVVEYSADQASKMAETPWSGTWTIEGTLGQLRWAGGPTAEPEEAFVELTRNGETQAVAITEPQEPDRLSVLSEFLDAIHGRQHSQLEGSDNISTLRIVVEAAASIRASTTAG